MTGWKGTPGPWQAERLPSHMTGCRRITAKVGPQHKQAKRSELACTSGLYDDEQDVANAKGMAAVPDLVDAVVIVGMCEGPEQVSIYDQECVDAWKWTHPDGREWHEIGDWNDPAPMHPVAAAALAKAGVQL